MPAREPAIAAVKREIYVNETWRMRKGTKSKKELCWTATPISGVSNDAKACEYPPLKLKRKVGVGRGRGVRVGDVWNEGGCCWVVSLRTWVAAENRSKLSVAASLYSALLIYVCAPTHTHTLTHIQNLTNRLKHKTKSQAYLKSFWYSL